MGTQIKAWEIQGKALIPVQDSSLAIEGHQETELEDWITQCPDILGEDLMVICEQLDTAQAGILDLLCMDNTGKLVLIELKRDRAPRDAVAQALDYASWLESVPVSQIMQAAKTHLSRELDEAFEEHFKRPMPEWTCQSHRVIIVAARLDTSAERIVNYLAQKYGVEINVVFFRHAKLSDGKEILLRSVLVPEEMVISRTGAPKNISIERLLELAEDNKTSSILNICRRVGREMWYEKAENTSGGSFRYWGENVEGRPKMVFGVNVSGELANAGTGQLDIWIRPGALAEVCQLPEPDIRKKLSMEFSPFKAPSGQMDFVIRLEKPEDAKRLVSTLELLYRTVQKPNEISMA